MNQYKEYEPLFGSWYITRKIAEGEHDNIFEIEKEGEEKTVALKVISIPKDASEINELRTEGYNPEEYFLSIVKQYRKEFMLMDKLKNSNNLVKYDDYQMIRHADGIGWDIFIRMELLTPFCDYVNENEFSIRDLVKMGIDVCKGIEKCEDVHIIHRDIKPENIFLSEDQIFKIGNFGIAKVAEKADFGTKAGTFSYMAPEVYNGEEYGKTVDIYSLGMMMYRLLNNMCAPFISSAEDEQNAIKRRMQGEKLPRPIHGTDELIAIVLKACEYDSSARFTSANEMRLELEHLIITDEGNDILLPVRSASTVTEEDQNPIEESQMERTEQEHGKDKPVLAEKDMSDEEIDHPDDAEYDMDSLSVQDKTVILPQEENFAMESDDDLDKTSVFIEPDQEEDNLEYRVDWVDDADDEKIAAIIEAEPVATKKEKKKRIKAEKVARQKKQKDRSEKKPKSKKKIAITIVVAIFALILLFCGCMMALVHHDRDPFLSSGYEEYAADFVLPDSYQTVIDANQIAQLSHSQTRTAINEIYARHGRKFEKKENRNWFKQYEWYKPKFDLEDFGHKVFFNDYEKQNLELLKDHQSVLKEQLEVSAQNAAYRGDPFLYDDFDAYDPYSKDFVLPDSYKEYIDQSIINELSAQEAKDAINEIYARHGRIFETEGNIKRFEKCEWYKPTFNVKDMDKSWFNEYESYNLNLLQELQKSR